MFTHRNYHPISNRVISRCKILALTEFFVLSILLLSQGCSTENQSQQALSFQGKFF